MIDINTSKRILTLAAEMSEHYYGEPLVICYSGGKDSDVILRLAMETLDPNQFEVLHAVTTVDSPVTNKYVNDIYKELAEKGIKATKAIPPQAKINIPPKHIDTRAFSFDYQHINEERNHNVTREMAEAWIRESKISASVWGGRFENFYGERGCVYIDTTNAQIRTAFSKEEYTEKLQALMEVLKDTGL